MKSNRQLDLGTSNAGLHQMRRQRRDVQMRAATVEAIEHVTPHMLRVHVKSDELRSFRSDSFDDHVKLFFPSNGDRIMRDYTPRLFDRAQGTLAIDFALHDHGPAIEWARQAKPGQTLTIGGPKGSVIIPDDFDWYLLIGDETALPAIGRRVEELRANVPVTTIAVIEDQNEIQSFPTKADWTPVWITRSQMASDETSAVSVWLRHFHAPKGDGFVWIAGEASLASTLKELVVSKLKHPADWVKASGYWTRR